MRILIYSSELLFGEALASLLARRGHTIAGCPAEAEELIELIDDDLDVVLVDLADAEATHIVTLHAGATVVLLHEMNAPLMQKAIELGATGVCMKVDVIEEIERVLERASRPHGPTPVVSVATRSHATRRVISPPGARLTPKEQAVLSLIIKGTSTVEIAKQLGVSTATVRTHLQHLFAKFGVHSRIALAAAAVRRGVSTRNDELAVAR